MQTRNRGDYTIAGHELVAEGADLRVQVRPLRPASACRGITTLRSATASFVLRGRWWSRHGHRATSIVSCRASAVRCRLRPRIRCMARPMARASFSSCKASACTTSLRSAGELVSPHIRASDRSPTSLLSGGCADRARNISRGPSLWPAGPSIPIII